MHKQITVGVIAIIALAAMGAITSQSIQSQLERRNDPVGGDLVEQQVDFGVIDKITGLRDIKAAAPPAITGDNIYVAW